MLYAQVVLGIPVEGPFDYIVPADMRARIKIGARVRVDFRNQKTLAYVVGLSPKTRVRRLKSLLEVIDEEPVLDKNMLTLARRLSEYYCCSWGEAIETALPQALRKGRKIPPVKAPPAGHNKNNPQVSLIQDLTGLERWDVYLREIKETLDNHASAIVLLPDINSALAAKKRIETGLGIQAASLYRKEPGEQEEWRQIKEGKFKVVVGTRSAIFAPLSNLGLVIIDEEQDSSYKQDQVPHYHARVAALMRAEIEKARLILASTAPSLEALYLAGKDKAGYTLIPLKSPAEVKIINTQCEYFKINKARTSKYLEDAIGMCLNSKLKALLFLNRKGFATLAACSGCGAVLKCPRCNINLVYHFKENILTCHYCNFKMAAPKVCPQCNSGYLRYSGAGTEKIESDGNRVFAQARIKRMDGAGEPDPKDFDILISTQSIIRHPGCAFGLVGVLDIDNSLQRIDFRASERAFGLLLGLLGLAKEKMVIQTGLAAHHCFQALARQDVAAFYDKELKERKELDFPPFKHLVMVKLRGQKESRVREASEALFKKLNNYAKNGAVKLMAVSSAQPAKLRGNFCWQILLRANSAPLASKFLKKHLKDFSHSGIIVTVDVDPV
ncbi:MAG: primosomal protein N' [Candidatus Omnitrophica bacterium]|nr:primosomal protein N' [Candidatus Omnitrophota bacterium]